jgi:hypothetical protein
MKALKSHPISVVAIFSTRFEFHGDEREGRCCDLENQLLRLIEAGSGFAKEQACMDLQALTFSKENTRAIGDLPFFSLVLKLSQPEC